MNMGYLICMNHELTNGGGHHKNHIHTHHEDLIYEERPRLRSPHPLHPRRPHPQRPYPLSNMPRTSEKHQVLEEIESATEFATCALLVSPPEEEEVVKAEDDIKDLLALQDIVESHRYVSCRSHGQL